MGSCFLKSPRSRSDVPLIFSPARPLLPLRYAPLPCSGCSDHGAAGALGRPHVQNVMDFIIAGGDVVDAGAADEPPAPALQPRGLFNDGDGDANPAAPEAPGSSEKLWEVPGSSGSFPELAEAAGNLPGAPHGARNLSIGILWFFGSFCFVRRAVLGS